MPRWNVPKISSWDLGSQTKGLVRGFLNMHAYQERGKENNPSWKCPIVNRKALESKFHWVSFIFTEPKELRDALLNFVWFLAAISYQFGATATNFFPTQTDRLWRILTPLKGALILQYAAFEEKVLLTHNMRNQLLPLFFAYTSTHSFSFSFNGKK